MSIVSLIVPPSDLSTQKTGFVKAFSEHASSFVHFGTKVQTVMESLGVKKLMLWPRFRNEVKETLDKNPLEIRNFRPHMTPLMQKTHTAIKRLIDDCLDEIEQANKVRGRKKKKRRKKRG